MASGQESGSSTALEGLYAELHGLGLPFSISGELQSYQLTLDSSAWTVRRSKSGISVSLFWPCARPGEIPSRQSAKSRPNNTKRKSKNKKKNKKPPLSTVNDTQPLGKENVLNDGAPRKKSVGGKENVLNDGAPRKKTEGVDLCSCSSVEYQERDSVPGVTYTDKSGTCGWTEVRGRRSRRRTVGNLPSSRPSSASEQSESDSEDFVRPPSSTVKFVAVDGQPGLHVSSPRIRSWTPIATRTRSRIKPI